MKVMVISFKTHCFIEHIRAELVKGWESWRTLIMIAEKQIKMWLRGQMILKA